LLFTVGVDTAKELIYARMQIDAPGPGYMHYNRRCDEEYFKQLTAEKQVTKFSKGFPTKVWVKVRSRNEALDCEVYALAAYTLMNVNVARMAQEMDQKAENIKAIKAGVTPEALPNHAPTTRQNFIRKVSGPAWRPPWKFY